MAKRLHQERIVYDGPGGPFEGFVVWDPSRAGPRPGVMVVHTFKGQSAFENEKAEALARLGYVGFAIDLYGQGRRAETPDVANALMAELNDDRPLLARRINAALDAMKAMEQVDAGRTAAIGFCFGGKCVLDLARSGADVSAVASFHGIFDPPPDSSGPIKAAILVLHGWNDPLAPPDSVQALAAELGVRAKDWQIHAYGHVGHSFTNPKARAPESGMAYDRKANDRAWVALEHFLTETLGAPA